MALSSNHHCFGTRTRFWFRPAGANNSLTFTASASCLMCARQMRIVLGAIYCQLTVGKEVLGVVCDTCLNEESRATVQQMRKDRAPAVLCVQTQTAEDRDEEDRDE